ncbi:NIL domain-containing protein [Moorella naiadis]|uniref:NIL domain-containing protein n=1 Tax=Moorella naiadis (nom. illeg.) TaxID=3093670 RepID=UPI003D9CB3E2
MSPKRVVLRFMAATADQPIIYQLIRNYDLMINILKAHINPYKEGMMVLEIQGEPEQYTRGLEYLRSLGITIQPLSQDVHRNANTCTHCGACISVCPTGALYLERPDMTVHFDEDKCVVCLMCVRACPYKAMEVRF